MLYHAIPKARKKYRSAGYGNDYDVALSCYRDALKKRCCGPNSDTPSPEEAWILLSFANGWNARMRATFCDVQRALAKIESDLEKLRCKTIYDVRFNEKIDDERNVGDLIGRCFMKLKKCGGGQSVVGPSKILHLINPNLFVMWDTEIIDNYGKGECILYSDFLCKMQALAKNAVCQVMKNERHHSNETAIASLTGPKHTLAKALDEYNFMKYTKQCASVRKAERE